MSIPLIEVRGCESEVELNEVVELCDAAFSNTTREYFVRHLLKDKTLALNDTRILLKDGKIVSSVQIFPRIISLQKGELKYGGIGNVATLPSERSRGYAGILLKDAFDYMVKKDFPVSMLTTHINSYYEKFGFKTVLRTIARISNVKGIGCKDVKVFDEFRDFENVINLYKEFNINKTGTIVRDKRYWQSQFDFCDEDKDLFLVYYPKDVLKGFVRAQRKEKIIKVQEYAFRSADKTVLTKLFQCLSYITGFNEIEMFLTKKEEDYINPGFPFSFKRRKRFYDLFP